MSQYMVIVGMRIVSGRSQQQERTSDLTSLPVHPRPSEAEPQRESQEALQC